MKVVFVCGTYPKEFPALSEGHLDYKIILNDYNFAQKWAIINDVNDLESIPKDFPEAVDHIFPSRQILPFAMAYFKLPMDFFVDKKTGIDGLKYSVASLCALFLAQDFDYLCYYCGDAELYRRKDWITEGIEKIEQGYVGAHPRKARYGFMELEPGEQSLTETNIFTDNVYLLPIKPIRENLKDILSTPGQSLAKIHPDYGGDSLERKMSRYLRATKQKMAVIRSAERMHIDL